jgi:transglutaminase-like putative cysteine protease
MMYRIRHETIYQYSDPVSVSHHVLRLTPRDLPNQVRTAAAISIVPAPQVQCATHLDYFGNNVTSFSLQEPHERLTIEAACQLEVRESAPPVYSQSPPWESVREQLKTDHSSEGLEAYQFAFDSKRISARPELAAYAGESFPAGRPLLEAILDLTSRIHQEFRFDTKATEVTTPVETFFEKRRGVCQDFSHLQIACLRSLGLPARYVSGYLRTLPPKGKPRLIGADATHAWCSAWCPGTGWVDFDPTNNCIPTNGHITMAWGRDYSDVSPIHGVLLGGARHTLKVGVDVIALDD